MVLCFASKGFSFSSRLCKLYSQPWSGKSRKWWESQTWSKDSKTFKQVLLQAVINRCYNYSFWGNDKLKTSQLPPFNKLHFPCIYLATASNFNPMSAVTTSITLGGSSYRLSTFQGFKRAGFEVGWSLTGSEYEKRRRYYSLLKKVAVDINLLCCIIFDRRWSSYSNNIKCFFTPKETAVNILSAHKPWLIPKVTK